VGVVYGVLGCGNSSLAVDLYNDGFKNIVNIDYSSVVISNMQRRHKTLKGIEWVVMDMTDMSDFLPSLFDVVLEKGTLDALLVAEKDPWKLSHDAEDVIDTILCQVNNLLGRKYHNNHLQSNDFITIFLSFCPDVNLNVSVYLHSTYSIFHESQFYVIM